MSHKLNLVRVLTAATGNSSPITLGAAYSQLFMLPSEAGVMDGRTYSYLIVDGNNFELGRGVYTASGTTLSRNVIVSRISGTLGTSRISLSGTAQVRFIESAEDMDGVRGTRPVTGTSDTLANSDLGYVVTYSNASAIAVTLAQAATSGLFLDGWATFVKNKGVGAVTITPATSTIDAASTLVLQQNQGAFIWSDGTNYQTLRFNDTAKIDIHGADIASAGTLNLETATGDLVDVTGTTTITAITLSEGHERTVRFTGALTLTNGASLVLPGGANITTAAGDFAVFRGYGSSVVRCVDYIKADGTPVVPGLKGAFGQCVLAKVSSNIVLSPKGGNLLTVNGVVCTLPDAGVSLAPTGLTSGTLYYIYAVATAGVISSIEASTTGHSTSTTAGNKGVEIKTGDDSRSLVGMVRPTSGPAFADSATQRFVRSWFNRSNASLKLTGVSGSYSSMTGGEVNSGNRVEGLVWADETFDAWYTGTVFNDTAGANFAIGISVDGGTPTGGTGGGTSVNANSIIDGALREAFSGLSEGYHYIGLWGRVSSGSGSFFANTFGSTMGGRIN
jgi:hypothetical protein